MPENHAARAAIRSYMAEHPGVAYNEAARRLGLRGGHRIEAWESANCYAMVSGTTDPDEVVEAWNALIVKSYGPETDEFRDGITSSAQVRAHWELGYVDLPFPDNEQPFTYHDAPAPGRCPVWSTDYSNPGIGFLREEDCTCPRNSFDCLSPAPGDPGCTYCSGLDSEASCPQDPDYIEALKD